MANPVVGCGREHDGLRAIADAEAQTLEKIAVDQRIASVIEALRIGPGLQEGFGAAEIEAAHIGLIRASLDVEAAAPLVRQIELAVGEEMSAKRIDRRDRLIVQRSRPVRIGGARIDFYLAVAPALPVLAREHRARVRRDDGRERHVLVGIEDNEVGRPEEITDRGRVPEDRRQESGRALDGGVGLGDIG